MCWGGLGVLPSHHVTPFISVSIQHNNSHAAFRLRVEDNQVSSHILQHNNSHTAFRLRVEDSQVSSHILQHNNSHTAFRLRIEDGQAP